MRNVISSPAEGQVKRSAVGKGSSVENHIESWLLEDKGLTEVPWEDSTLKWIQQQETERQDNENIHRVPTINTCNFVV